MSDNQFTTPLTISGGETTRLIRIPFSERTFNESWLQELLFKHPLLIPFREIEPIFAESNPVVRELPTPAGPADLLYINSSGFMTIVETKLWRNPEARRSVVAQIIDYAKEMAKWSYDDLIDAVKRAGIRSNQDPLIELVKEEDGEDFDERRFIDQVSRNLRYGRFLLLIVGDGIHEGVEEMAVFLQQTPQLGYNLALVEIGLFRANSESLDPLFVQPRVIARTREIVRAIVEVKTLDSAAIEVTLPDDTTSTTTSTRRKRITEEEFFDQLEEMGDSNAVELARWVLDNAENYSLRIDWLDAGPMLKYVDPTINKFFSFGQLHRDGVLVTDRLFERFKKLGLPPEIYREYFDEVAQLIPNASRRRFTANSGRFQWDQIAIGANPKPSDNPPLAQLAPHKEKWMEITEKAIQRIQKALGDDW